MVVVRLTQDVPGLGREGDRVIADPARKAQPGDWAVVEHEQGAWCVRWQDELPDGALVLAVV